MVRSAATEGVYHSKQVDKNTEDTVVSKNTDPHFTTQLKDAVLSKQDNTVGSDHALPNIDMPVLLGRTFINDPDEGENKFGHRPRKSNHSEGPSRTVSRNSLV